MTKLYVGNLPFTATEDAVRNLFAPHGTVEKLSLINDRDTGRPRGFGFVEMSSADAARAMTSDWRPPAVGSRATWTRTITAADVESFARFSGDRNPLHFDPAFAAATRAGGLIVHGGLTTALFNALVGE